MSATTINFLILLTLTSFSISTAATTTNNATPTIPYSPSLFPTILSTLGFQDLSTAATHANLSTTTPVTIFAPSDSSLLTCPTCSVPFLLQEHSLPGLYPLHYLRFLAFGTKIETLAPNRCLTITSSPAASTSIATKKVFVNGVEITKPDLFNNGLIIVHGLQGFMSHLSPLSCSIEHLTSLSFPPHPPLALAFVTRLMLKDAMMRLRVAGYSIVALAMRVKYAELSDFKSMSIFALDDASIFAGGMGHTYVADLGYHIVPNRLLMGSDLVGLPSGTALPTMERGQSLVVTSAGGGGPMAPMRINYIKIKSLDLVHNDKIVIHGVSMPFPHVDRPTAGSDFRDVVRSMSRSAVLRL